MAGKIAALVLILSLALVALPLQPEHGVSANSGMPEVWVAPPPAGDDSNPGAEAQPFATIHKGRDSVAEGGTIHVAAGTYDESTWFDDNLTIVGAGALTTFINHYPVGVNEAVIGISTGGQPKQLAVTISGFTIQNGNNQFLDVHRGGGVFVGGNCTVYLNNCSVVNNTADNGGGISNSGTLYLNDCTIGNNDASGGGGIYNDGRLIMNRCAVSGNSAVYGGGGIYNIPGVIVDSGTMWLTNCTISGNTVTTNGGGGGGICGQNDTIIRLVNVTIANNRATGTGSHGGGFANISDSIPAVGNYYFKNCIVSGNTAGESIYNNGYDTYKGVRIHTQGHNIDSENSCYFNDSTDQRNTDPLLGPLRDNGGPTFTQALLHGSPAIDAGETVVDFNTDQRGVPRPQGTAWDIGAYELTQASVATATGGGTAYFSVLSGYFTNLTAQNESALACPPREDLSFPHGLFSFTVTGITPGSSVTVVIILPANVPANSQYWKCINGQWVDCTSLLGSNDGDSVLTLTIKDGGLGDADGRANGSITDPGGPALAVTTPPAAQIAVRTPPQSSSAYVAAPVSQAPVGLPNIYVQNASLSASRVAPGATLTVNASVANRSTVNGSTTIKLYVNGQEDSSRGVNVNSGSVIPVTFTVSRSQPGTYAVYVNGAQAGSFTVEESVDLNLILIISCALILIALVLGFIYISRRQRYTS